MQLAITVDTDKPESVLHASIFLRKFALFLNPDVEIPASPSVLALTPPPPPSAADLANVRALFNTPPVLSAATPPPPPASVVTVPFLSGLTIEQAKEVAPNLNVQDLPRDSTGAYWDATLHSESKALNKDGTWRARRNVASKAAPPASLAPAAAAPPPPAVEAAAPASPPVGLHLVPPPAPAVSAPGVLSGDVTDFRSLMTQIGPLLSSQKLTADTLGKVCTQNGLASLGELVTKQTLVPKFWADIRATVGV